MPDRKHSLWELFWSRNVEPDPSIKASSDSVMAAAAELMAKMREQARKAADDAHD